MAQNEGRKDIIIIGGGIIGSTTAYYLTRHPSFDPAKHTITLLEASKIAGGASGKAGGLLGLWAYPSNLVPLSFRLHEELAKEHGGEQKWGYRRVGVGQLDAKGRPFATRTNGTTKNTKPGNGTNGDDFTAGPVNSSAGIDQHEDKERISLQKRTQAALSKLRAKGLPADLDWVADDAVNSYDEMAGPDETAQVHPYQFTTSMASLAEQAGVKILLGAKVTSIDPSKTSTTSPPAVESVTYTTSSTTEPGQPQNQSETHTLPATHVILAAGPWTSRLLPSSGIGALRAHSVTIRPARPVSAYALFTHITLPSVHSSLTGESKRRQGKHSQTVTPEIYARPNNEVYACGEGDHLIPLPETSADVQTDDNRCQDIVDYVGSISDELRDGEVTVRQACYLPVCDNGGGPWIGEVKEMKGLVIAAGHSCWGIQNGPATGKLVSEIVMEGQARSAKLGVLDPKRAMY